MGILAAIAGLTLPALRGPLDKSRLRHSAREVQSALAKTRALAIRAGEAHSFRYETGGRNFRIETTAPADTSPTTDGLLETARLPGELGDPLAADAVQVEPELRTVRTGQLPDGAVFAVLSTLNTVTEFSTADALATGQPPVPALADASSNDASTSRWSEPVRFAPNGRASNTTIRIQGSRDFHIDISLRGLTGIASYSAPERAVPAAQNVSTEGATSNLALNPDANSGGLE